MTERRRDRDGVRAGGRHSRIEHVAARALLEATSIDEAASGILQAICETLGWSHGALWVVDRASDRLRLAHIYNPPSVQLPEFVRISHELTFARGVGLPGRVWASGEPVWIPDVTLDQNFPRARIAVREHLHAAFGFPITVRGDVISVMEFFNDAIQEPDRALLSTLDRSRPPDWQLLRAPPRAGRARSLLHDVARHALSGRLRRLLQACQPRLAEAPGMVRGRTAVAAVYRADSPGRPDVDICGRKPAVRGPRRRFLREPLLPQERQHAVAAVGLQRRCRPNR